MAWMCLCGCASGSGCTWVDGVGGALVAWSLVDGSSESGGHHPPGLECLGGAAASSEPDERDLGEVLPVLSCRDGLDLGVRPWGMRRACLSGVCYLSLSLCGLFLPGCGEGVGRKGCWLSRSLGERAGSLGCVLVAVRMGMGWPFVARIGCVGVCART